MTSSPFRICVVCSGNICRSPIGEVVLRQALEQAGLGDAVEVDSAGTGGWHVGDGADPRTLRALTDAGYDGSAHRAQQFEPDWVAGRDLVLVADGGHLRAVRALARGGDTDHVRLIRDFDPAADDPDLADPYFGDAADFATVLDQVRAATPGIVEHVRAQLPDDHA